VNAFDAVVTVMLIMAARAGFKTGLLRSTATALGYLTAMPVAVAITPLVSPAFAGNSSNPVADSSVLLLGVFLVTGMALGAVFRSAVAETIGPDISMADRLAGSMVGSLRTLLVAITMVLSFDQIIAADRQPSFLNGSRLRPILSAAGQKGLKSLPPEVMAWIDRWKKDQLRSAIF
jgi:membrane protein required for colicin V production